MNPAPGRSSLLWWFGAAAAVGLGVFAFLVCGLGYLIFRRRKK